MGKIRVEGHRGRRWPKNMKNIRVCRIDEDMVMLGKGRGERHE